MVDPNIASQFDEIYDSTHRTVLSFITARCKHTADIHDIFQETYMEFYKLLVRRGVEYVTNDKALIMRIARRKLSRYYSFMERFRMFISITVKKEDGEEVELSDLEAKAFAEEDVFVNHLLLEEARQYIRSKPDDVKKVFYLFYDMDLTIAEIAKELSISESNVKHKLYRTLKKLRNLLQ